MLCLLSPDVASEEQQKMTMPLNEDSEEPISEDAAMETDAQNTEDLKEIEKLNPEIKMSDTSKSDASKIGIFVCFLSSLLHPSGIISVLHSCFYLRYYIFQELYLYCISSLCL